MTEKNISRDNSVFIKESRAAHAENLKGIILMGIISAIITVFALFAILPDISVKPALTVIGAAACVIAAAVNIILENIGFKRFTDFIYGMDESGFNGLNAQAVKAERDFGMLYMLDEYVYLCPKHVLIPFRDIKDVRLSMRSAFSRGTFRRGATGDFYMYCYDGKKYTVHLDGNYFKYSGGEEAFKAMMNLKISKSHNL